MGPIKTNREKNENVVSN